MTGPLALIEDSDEDFAAIRRALAGTAGELLRFADGRAALDGLRALATEGRQWPSLLLVDLNLPGSGGLDLLRELRAEPALRGLPIVVLSGSTRPEEVRAAYEHGANAYVVKPLAFAELRDTLEAVWRFWNVVSVPGPPGRAASSPDFGLL